MLSKKDYYYHLPERLIAQEPLAERDASRMLCLDRCQGVIKDSYIANISRFLQQGDLLVLNNTRVIPARLFARKQTGGKVEIMIERLIDENTLVAQLRSSKTPKIGQILVVDEGFRFTVIDRDNDLFKLKLTDPGDIDDVLSQAGHIPLPPYIKRADTKLDKNRYQTVFAEQPGAVAAPTAGLHFDQKLLDTIREKGVEIGYITLHVGAGTFQPVRVENLSEHVMHSEIIDVSDEIISQIHKTKQSGKRVIAVGTTVIRALETACLDGQIKPYQGETDLFVLPGFEFKCVDALLTNFHVSESTLLALVCAFGGYTNVMNGYQHAITNEYRFYSYGDAMFIGNILS